MTNAPAERSVGVTFIKTFQENIMKILKRIFAIVTLILVILLISYAVFTAKQTAISEAAYEALQSI